MDESANRSPLAGMHVIVAHNPVGPDDDLSTVDVLDQVDFVASGFAALGVPAERIAVPGARPWEVLPRDRPDLLVFNLVEAPTDLPHLAALNAAALESLGLAFSGSSAAAIWLTTDKIAARALLASVGLPVAAGGRLDLANPTLLDRVPPPWILKPAGQDASIGIDGNPVASDRQAALERGAELARRFPDQPILLERFLPGREFNVSLLARENGGAHGGDPEVLPIPEMLFVDFPPGMPRIMGYEAKWAEGTFAYESTRRHFPEPAAGSADAALFVRLRELALAAWHTCGLRGYARVDLRLDESGEPAILEINANPCLAAEAGFPAAAAHAGLDAGTVIGRIVGASLPAGGARCSVLKASPARVRRSRHPALREGLEPGERAAIEAMLAATAFFNREEIQVAMELVDERLAEGESCHYRFLVATCDGVDGADGIGGRPPGDLAGYVCWGPIAGTAAAADLYWIVVDPRLQRGGVGAALMAAAEERMAAAGRTRVYVETSTRAQYEPTRAFYTRCGYHLTAELSDFYAPGDGKAVFLKVLGI